jgi:hypothetical protein
MILSSLWICRKTSQTKVKSEVVRGCLRPKFGLNLKFHELSPALGSDDFRSETPRDEISIRPNQWYYLRQYTSNLKHRDSSLLQNHSQAPPCQGLRSADDDDVIPFSEIPRPASSHQYRHNLNQTQQQSARRLPRSLSLCCTSCHSAH